MMSLGELAAVKTIDLTTYGRKTGLPRRIEIWWFHLEGRFFITGTPGRRDWLANIRANPRVVIHVQDSDFEATAHEVVDPQLRELVFSQPETRWYSTQSEFRHLVNEAPMVEILLGGGSGAQRFDLQNRAELI